jgi:hypothetical protein
MAATLSDQPKLRREVGFTREKGKALTYSRIPKDKNGWAKAEIAVPRKGDLVELKMADHRTIIGWWAGAYWFGHRVKEKDKVKKWKLASFDYE